MCNFLQYVYVAPINKAQVTNWFKNSIIPLEYISIVYPCTLQSPSVTSSGLVSLEAKLVHASHCLDCTVWMWFASDPELFNAFSTHFPSIITLHVYFSFVCLLFQSYRFCGLCWIHWSCSLKLCLYGKLEQQYVYLLESVLFSWPWKGSYDHPPPLSSVDVQTF